MDNRGQGFVANTNIDRQLKRGGFVPFSIISAMNSLQHSLLSLSGPSPSDLLRSSSNSFSGVALITLSLQHYRLSLLMIHYEDEEIFCRIDYEDEENVCANFEVIQMLKTRLSRGMVALYYYTTFARTHSLYII
ncbi:uncharacterized protein LOC110008051 [Amborella trichopoda]|uniref:uncharacterized protein LOC110008051 n=1 Tax=Amborella trichopoda TaxID=13333 RepID=UPI0009C0C228|nr:uncharacterized protein LOC110008051 [Amborella trichopoda]|eukprot:XP_020528808.1 uncharacterized protein LOC110008051 [Amborella trichopoda]